MSRFEDTPLYLLVVLCLLSILSRLYILLAP
jgi:hypothetical protein